MNEITNLTQYLRRKNKENRAIYEIITQYGFSISVKLEHNNKSISFEFKDSNTNSILFIIWVNSFNEAINLFSLFEWITEVDT